MRTWFPGLFQIAFYELELVFYCEFYCELHENPQGQRLCSFASMHNVQPVDANQFWQNETR